MSRTTAASSGSSVPDPFDADEGWSEAFGGGAEVARASRDDEAGAGRADVSSAFDFEPDEVSSDDDYDFTGDGVVDHHDVHEVLTGFHDFQVDEADTHHPDVHHHDHDIHPTEPVDDHGAGHLGHHLHDGGHGGGGDLLGF